MPSTLLIIILVLPSIASADEVLDARSHLGLAVSWDASWSDGGFSPRAGSVRWRLPSGLVLEPRVGFEQSRTQLLGAQTLDEGRLDAGLGVRIPVASRNSVELQFLTAATVSRWVNTVDPASVGHATWAYLGWGLGLECFAAHRMSLGVDAMSGIAGVNLFESGLGSSRGFVWGPFFDPGFKVNAALYF